MLRFSCNNCRVQGFFDPRRRWWGDPFFGGPTGAFGSPFAAAPFAAGPVADPFAGPFAGPFGFNDGFDPIGDDFGYSGFSRYTALYNRRFY